MRISDDEGGTNKVGLILVRIDVEELGAGKHVHELEVGGGKPGLFAQFTPRGILEGFTRLHGTTGDAPLAAVAAPVQEHAIRWVQDEDCRHGNQDGTMTHKGAEFSDVCHGQAPEAE